MADQKTLADLRKCMREAKGNTDAMAACEKAFTDAGGAVTRIRGRSSASLTGARPS